MLSEKYGGFSSIGGVVLDIGKKKWMGKSIVDLDSDMAPTSIMQASSLKPQASSQMFDGRE